ncbi:MAG: TonB family protein [Rhodospirillales bacterium]|nr:TonB family protein [Rhodospirillales bacterium]
MSVPRFHHVWAMAVMGSAMLHATALAALLPEVLPRQERLSEQAIELTLERPTAPFEAPAVPAAEQAAQRLPSGASAFQSVAALAPGPSEAASAPLPAPTEPHIAQTLPSAEPPPAVLARDFGTSTTPTAAEARLETMLPGVDVPPLVNGQDFARTAPSALARSSILQSRPQAPPPQQVVRQATPKRASQQNESDPLGGQAPGAPSPVARTATSYSAHQAQQDYLLQVVRKLSQERFTPATREQRERGLVVVQLTIGRDGRLVDVALSRPSGSPALDRGVLETVRRASPFAPLPTELAAGSHTFIVPINYAQER